MCVCFYRIHISHLDKISVSCTMSWALEENKPVCTLERQACVEYRTLFLVSRKEAPLRDCGCYREEVSGSVQS